MNIKDGFVIGILAEGQIPDSSVRKLTKLLSSAIIPGTKFRKYVYVKDEGRDIVID